MAPDTCRPFDRYRKGLVLAEGAGCWWSSNGRITSKGRGAEILAQIASGVGMSADAADLVAPAARRRGQRDPGVRLADANLPVECY